MRCFLALLLSGLFLFQSCFLGWSSFGLKAQAYEGEAFWSKPTFEKKLFKVGQRLLEKNDIKELITFRVYKSSIFNRDPVNAGANDDFAVVHIEPGLLKYIDNDDELAAVLSHEIAHVMLRHGRKARVGRIVSTLLITVPITVATLGLDLGLIGIGAAKAATSKQSRKFEMEADAIGLKLLINAGYDPKAMENLLLKIGGDGGALNVWRSHPKTTERIRAVRLLTQTYLDEAKKAAPNEVEPKTSEQSTKAKSTEAKSTVEPANTEVEPVNNKEAPDFNTELQDSLLIEPSLLLP